MHRYWAIPSALLLLITLHLQTNVEALNFTVPDLIISASDVGRTLIKTDLLPSPEELIDGSKQLIAGYPFEFVSNAINSICSKALSSKNIKSRRTPDINKMSFQLRTACHKYSYSLLNAEEMWSSPAFDVNKKLVVLATGWTTTINDTEAIELISQAYACRGDVNFVAVDTASFVDTLYTWSAFNTEAIGDYIGKGLALLADRISPQQMHLIGHSLGAHIVGAAGRSLQRLNNQTVARITGLDPAKPCFNEGETLSGLLRGDADFIDVIHSNPGVLGKSDPLGDVDFYPGGLAPLPKGCVTVVCAHERAWRYYAETVFTGNEYSFLGKRCNSLTSLREGHCPGQDQPMGYATPHHLKGNYFLEINAASPFGQNGGSPRSQKSKIQKCGLCPNKN